MSEGTEDFSWESKNLLNFLRHRVDQSSTEIIDRFELSWSTKSFQQQFHVDREHREKNVKEVIEFQSQ